MRDILRVTAAIVLSCLAIGFCPWPYVWVFLLGSSFCLGQINRSSRITTKALWFNIGIIVFIFAVFEAVLSWQDGKLKEAAARLIHVRAYDTESDDVLAGC